MTETAAARVDAIALHENQPLIQDRGLVVEWRPDHPIDDSEYDVDFVPRPDLADNALGADDFAPILDDELHDLLVPPHVGPTAPDVAAAQGAIDGVAHDDENANDADDQDVDANNDDNDDDADDHDVDKNNDDADQGANPNGDDEEQGANPYIEEAAGVEEEQGANAGAGNIDEPDNNAVRPYNLRARQPKATFNSAMDNPHSGKSYYPPASTNVQYDVNHHRRDIYGFIMTQMSAKAGIKKHGKAAEAAMMKEFAQLENLNVYQAIDPKALTPQQKKEALRAINLIKEKRDGRLKGRTVADGRPQRNLYDKSETASPTVSSDALMLSIIVDAHENRDVATADVAGAYLKADMHDFVIMKFTGASVDLLCETNPKHLPFVTVENGIKVLYVKLSKAMYGCVKSALLWYDVFHGALKEMGFQVNPYDSCIANCMIGGSQCTIAWYVDDTKISHVDPAVVTSIIDRIEGKFGKMTVTRGREHTFLGMKIRYTKERTAVVTMKGYLQEAIDESGLYVQRTATTPARKNLFVVNESAPLLDKQASESFHSVVAKLLYVSIRARMDLLLAVGFLCTRVSKSTIEDQNKLKRVLEYVKGTMDLEYTVGADDMNKLRTWVDASYAVHPDMRSHTGVHAMSLGRGGVLCKSTKHKLNTKKLHRSRIRRCERLPPQYHLGQEFPRSTGIPDYRKHPRAGQRKCNQTRKEWSHIRGPEIATHSHSVLLDEGPHPGRRDHDPPLPYPTDGGRFFHKAITRGPFPKV